MQAWNRDQAAARQRLLRNFDAAGAAEYDRTVAQLSSEDQEAYLLDLAALVDWRVGMRVLDAGAGSGAMTEVLSRIEGLEITALEPSTHMLALLRARPGLNNVPVVQGFCDSRDDQVRFAAAGFDVVISRQTVNGLFDPLTAFENWHHWLRPGGYVVAIEGTYSRDAWAGAWSAEVDQLPLSATQSRATLPYLLERVGFSIQNVEWMNAVNARPITRTPRYVVVAFKPL